MLRMNQAHVHVKDWKWAGSAHIAHSAGLPRLTAHKRHEMEINLPPTEHTFMSGMVGTTGTKDAYRIRAASLGVRLICLPAVSCAATSTSEGARALGSVSWCPPFFSRELEVSDMIEPR